MGHSKEKDKNKERERTREKEGTKSKKKEEKESKKKEKKEKSYEFLKYPPNNQDQFRSILLDYLHSDLFDYPIYASELFDMIMKQFPSIKPNVKQSLDISSLLQEFGERKALILQQYCVGKKMQDFITDINKEKIIQLSKEYYKDHPEYQLKNQLRQTDTTENTAKENNNIVHTIKLSAINLEQQLKTKVGSEREALEESAKQYKIMNKLSQAEEQALAQFRKQQNKIDYCDFGTREKCQQARGIGVKCLKAHFEKIIRSHTDESLGNCSYLDTCRHMDQCKFVHYKLDIQSEVNSSPNNNIINNNIPSLSAIKAAASSNNSNSNKIEESKTIENLLQPQWICCDLRKLDFRVLGKFDVIMADPPWDIHMQLPYETMKDKEMKSLRVDLLQDEGLIFLWVTGRAMELGRECLQIWGYKQVEEIIWIKTNQLQRIIRTGRTGHWLNHSKEHCLVGIKGNPKINTMIDCDVIVSEVRETSRKPDEIYQVIERIHPGGRKIELFGRPHNCSTGWLTLGNQIPGVYILEEELLKNYSATYPDVETSKEKMEENRRQLLSTADQIYNSHIQQTPNYNNNNNTNNNNNNNNNNINNNKSNYKPPNQSPMNNNNHTAQIANIGAGQVVTGTLNSNNIENNDMINTSTGKINNQKISQIITKQITNTANNQINNQINSPINISNALNNNNNEPQVNNNYQIVNNNSNGKPFVSSGNRNFDPLNSQKKQFIDQSFPVQRLEPYFNQAPPTLPMNNQFFPNAFLNRQNFNNPRFQNQFFNNNLGYRTFNRFKYKNHQSQPFLPNNIDSINQNQNTNNQSFNINNNANNNNNNTTQKDQQQQ